MKRYRRALLLLPPLAGLALLLLPGTTPVTGPAAEQTAVVPAGNAASQAASQAQPAKPLPMPPAGKVWSFTGTVTGDEEARRRPPGTKTDAGRPAL